MKVCFITFEYPPNVIGGLGEYADQLVNGLKDKEVEVITIARGNKNTYGEKIIRILTPDYLYWRRLFFIRKAIDLFKTLNRDWKFDIVHLNGTYPISRSLRTPTVCTFHSSNLMQIKTSFGALSSLKTSRDFSSLLFRNPIGIVCEILSAHLSDQIICPSPSMAEEIQSYCFANVDKLHVIPNGIDLKKAESVKAFDATLLDRYDLEKGHFILYVGRLVYLKGVDYLIKAFAILRKNCEDIKLVIMGTGPCKASLEKAATELQGILFLGYVSSAAIKRLLYESCLTVVVPSLHEVLPTVAMEAMVYGTPVIATDVGGNSFLVKNGKNGFLVKPKDVVGLAQAVQTLYENRNLRKKMGAYGRELVRKQFSCKKMVTEVFKIYESLLDSSNK